MRVTFRDALDQTPDLVGKLLAAWTAGQREGGSPGLVPLSTVPPPFRHLLNQNRGMTAVLSEHWGSAPTVRVLRQAVTADGGTLTRDIVMVVGPEQQPIQLASIRIALDEFTQDFVSRLQQGGEPFGHLLQRNGIAFDVEVLGYLRLQARGAWADEGRVSAGTLLFGRVGRLWRTDGHLLAETVELLPRT
jgi:chorismate-pyruvate lyase